MIKVKVGLIKDNKIFMSSLQKFSKLKVLDASEKWKLYDVILVCEEVLKKTNKLCDEVIEKYATDNEEGKTWIDPQKLTKEQVESFNKEYGSILDNDIEFPIDVKIKVNEKVIEELTVEDLIALSSIIER
jgi:hypothetical protein